jgi:hypothetical protein
MQSSEDLKVLVAREEQCLQGGDYKLHIQGKRIPSS